MDDRIIKMKLDVLSRRAVVSRSAIDEWEARTAEYVAPGEYRYDSDWEPVTAETTWPALKTVFLRARASVGSADLMLEFDTVGLEGLLSVDGQPWAGVDVNHPRVALPNTGDLLLQAEFVSWLGALRRPELRRERSRLRGAAVIQVDRGIESLAYDLSFAWQASGAVSDERRRQLLDAALEEALLSIDLTVPDGELAAQAPCVRQRLHERLGTIAADPEAGHIYLTGHSHIDVAWLWPLRETVRKVGRTFATACRLMERYPDYHFSCSQPQLYAYARQHFPELYRQIRHWVAEGRWECTGGMWIESDCNVPSGESLIRQVLHGLAFFREEFGARPHTCWLPDVFGYPASLPGILAGCGLDGFFTCKLHWQARNLFPAHLFWWEGLDGTRILAHIPRLKGYYNGAPTPEELRIGWDGYLQKAAYPELLLCYGYGDGGGGPTAEMLEFAQRAEAFPGLPACRQGPGEGYFAVALKAAPDLPVWVGELYLETHRGTYTTQGAIKRANRRNELLLREAELFGVVARARGASVDWAGLRAAWEKLLLLQFHDILPGSSIGEVYREALADHSRIEATARDVRDGALRALAEHVAGPEDVVAFNSLSWERTDVVSLAIPQGAACFAQGAQPGSVVEVLDTDGHSTPGQVVGVRDGQAQVICVPRALPATGYAALALRAASGAPVHSLRVTSRQMESRYCLLDLGEDGTVVRLLDKRCGREVIPAGQPGNCLQLFQDGPEHEDAWNIHSTFELREYSWDPGTRLEVIEDGPVRAAVRVSRRYRETALEQDIVLYDQLPRVDFVTRVDWQARQTLLKVAFPLAVRSAYATYEIQFGAAERPTHRNTSWDQEKFEVCGHRWADLSEAGYGVSLLNDSKYGYDTHGNVLRLTLLRSTGTPDPAADRGYHEFTYALLPHLGDWSQSDTVQQGWELNSPVVVVPGGGGKRDVPARASFVTVDGPAVLQTLKPAEDGNGWIARLYEPHGGRGHVRVHLFCPLRRVVACNQVEEDAQVWPSDGQEFGFDILPFEVKAFRLQPG